MVVGLGAGYVEHEDCAVYVVAERGGVVVFEGLEGGAELLEDDDAGGDGVAEEDGDSRGVMWVVGVVLVDECCLWCG